MTFYSVWPSFYFSDRLSSQMSDDVQLFKEVGAKIGLHLIVFKCELIARYKLQPTGFLDGFSSVSQEDMNLHGAPLGPGNALD